MRQRTEGFTLLRRVERKNELLEREKAWEEVGTIHVALSVASGSTLEQNQALRVSSTHRGLTMDDVRAGDRFGAYTVDYVIPGRMYRQLFLTAVEPVEGETVDADQV